MSEPYEWEPPCDFDDDPDLWERCCRFTDEFPNWQFVPPELKSKKGWEASCRKVQKGAFHRGFVIDMTTYNKTVKLYQEADTVPYEPTTRTLAMRAFYAWLVRPTSKVKHIRWLDDEGDWRDWYGKLTLDDAKRHVNGREILGVLGGDRTHMRSIDLDLTWDGPEKLLERFKALQSAFHARDGWHYQIADEDAQGVHLVQVFRESAYLDACTHELKAVLAELDRKHPGLGLTRLEVYPAKNHGFRLPLCRGRSMLTDRPTRDVVEYMTWLLDPNQYMAAEEVFEYLRLRLKGVSAAGTQRTSGGAWGGSTKCRGSYRQLLTDFWSGKTTMALNEALILTARILPYEVDEDQAIHVLESYCDELPDKSFSRRLSCDRAEVSRFIRWVVEKVYCGNAGQADPGRSSATLAAVHDTYRQQGFFVSDKSTWNRTGLGKIKFEWSENEKEIIRAKLVPVLKCNEASACEAVRRFVTFVKRHAGNEIAMKAIPTILDGLDIHWCQDKKGRSKKLTAFVKRLVDLNWLYIAVTHSYHKDGTKGRSRQYGIGYNLADKFYKRSRDEADLLVPLPPPMPLPSPGGLLSYLVGNTTEKYQRPVDFDEFDEFGVEFGRCDQMFVPECDGDDDRPPRFPVSERAEESSYEVGHRMDPEECIPVREITSHPSMARS